MDEVSQFDIGGPISAIVGAIRQKNFCLGDGTSGNGAELRLRSCPTRSTGDCLWICAVVSETQYDVILVY